MAARIPHMKYAVTAATGGKEILANDHYVGVPFCAEEDHAAGDVVINLEKGITGVCLYDVNMAENPNGTLVIHGFIDATKLSSDQVQAFAENAQYMPMVRIVL
jgi:hypothetical protein